MRCCRPVYQSQLLPDVAVVGGLAEVAYGMQLPGVFARLGLEQPIVVPRDSALVMPGRWSGLAAKAGVDDAHGAAAKVSLGRWARRRGRSA